MRRALGFIAVLSLGILGSGCQAENKSESQEITVFAAASLVDVMKTLAATYQKEKPGAKLQFNYAASSKLVQQIQSGAVADVLITADEAALDNLVGTDALAGKPQIIASNPVTLAVAPGNPGNISLLTDLVTAKTVAVCAPEVPCGRAAQRVLDAENISLNNPSQENDVRAVLTKISSGQVDAGFVYSSDVQAVAGQGVTSIPVHDPVPNKYPAVLLRNGSENSQAQDFIRWLQSTTAQQILGDAGFTPGAISQTTSIASGEP